MANSEKQSRASSILRTLIVVLVVFALATAALLTFAHYSSLNQARLTLYSAKNARLAAMAVSAEHYAMGRSMADSATDSGFTQQAEQGILTLSQVQGQIRLLKTDAKGYSILSFAYRQGDYVAYYTAGEKAWRVEKVSALITA